MQASIELEEPLDEEKILECAADVLKESSYLSKTIDDFREFFSSSADSIERSNLSETFNKLQNLVEAAFKNNYIKFVLDIQDEVFININENIFIQSLINICNNAKDALVQNMQNSEDRVFFIFLEKDGKFAKITIKDSGGGIKSDVIDKIFEPYFTTKHQSIGTGIGLYMSHQIITRHLNGTIKVSNVEYEYNGKKVKGAYFNIMIPTEQNKTNQVEI